MVRRCSANTTEYVESSSRIAIDGVESGVCAATKASEECRDNTENPVSSPENRDFSRLILAGKLVMVRGGGEESCSWNVLMVRDE